MQKTVLYPNVKAAAVYCNHLGTEFSLFFNKLVSDNDGVVFFGASAGAFGNLEEIKAASPNLLRMGNYEEAYRRSQAERHNDNQTFDYDNLIYLLGELAGYKLEEKDRQKLQLLQEAAQVPDWERLKELIK